jgi:hypothetical protein
MLSLLPTFGLYLQQCRPYQCQLYRPLILPLPMCRPRYLSTVSASTCVSASLPANNVGLYLCVGLGTSKLYEILSLPAQADTVPGGCGSLPPSFVSLDSASYVRPYVFWLRQFLYLLAVAAAIPTSCVSIFTCQPGRPL